MIHVDLILPELERAVHDRTESVALSTMGPDDLRDLIYKLVERHQLGANDPTRFFSALIDEAEERHGDFRETLRRSIKVRASVLRMLLEVLEPAFPLLLGPIVMESSRDLDGQETRSHHALLHGVELINGKTEIGGSGKRFLADPSRSFCGMSLWIVGLPPEGDSDPVSCRFAILHHEGQRDSHRTLHTSRLQVVSSAEAAEKIKDFEFEKLIQRIHGRLLALSSPRVAKRTDKIDEVTKLLEAGLKAMGKHRAAGRSA